MSVESTSMIAEWREAGAKLEEYRPLKRTLGNLIQEIEGGSKDRIKLAIREFSENATFTFGPTVGTQESANGPADKLETTVSRMLFDATAYYGTTFRENAFS